MQRPVRYAVVAVVAVALLSTGAHALVEYGPSGYGSANCATGEVSVFTDDDASPAEIETAYADLGPREKRVVDRARGRSNNTATADPELVDDLPDSLVIDDTVYRVNTFMLECPIVGGTPRWSNTVIAPLWGIYDVFSPLYLPGLVVLGIVVGYRYVDDWLRFG